MRSHLAHRSCVLVLYAAAGMPLAANHVYGQAAPAEPITTQAALETRVKLATTLLHAQRYGEAIAEFEKVLAVEPAHREAAMGAARAHFWTGRPRKAMETLKPLVALPVDAEFTALWNEVLAASGDNIAALQAARESIAANPDSLDLRQSEAQLLTSFGCYEPAIEALQNLIVKAPAEKTDLALDLGLAYFAADRYPEARVTIEPLVPATTPIGRQARLLMGRMAVKTRDFEEARRVFESMQARDAGDPRACLGLLTCSILDAAGPEMPLEQCLALLEQKPVQLLLHEDDDVRDWMFLLLGQLMAHPATPERTELAERLVALLDPEHEKPATRICRDILQQYVEGGPEKVVIDVDWLIEAIHQESVERADLLEVCSLLLTLTAGEQLVEVSTAGLAYQENDIMLALCRAEGLGIMPEPEYDEAHKAYLRVLELLPECTKARRGLARVYSWWRAFDRAEETYNELIEQDPTDMVIQREAARSLGWDKQIRLSLDAFEDATELLGDSPAEQAWGDLLETERAAKRDFWWSADQDGLKQYQALIALEPTNLEARFDLAQIYARHRHWEEAAEQYLGILSIDPRHRRAREALYKNGLYHRPELRTEFQWTRESGRGGLVDVETSRLTETLKQEIARRTDFSLINTQMWHYFRGFGGQTIDEYRVMGRIDHQFDMQTYGHIASGYANLVGSELENRWIWDAALTNEPVDNFGITIGTTRQPWTRNWLTQKLGLDEDRVFVRLFGDVDPWLDYFVEYGRSWIDKGTWWPTIERSEVTKKNGLHELLWGLNYRFSLSPRILQFEYRGFAWWYDREVPSYWSPDIFVVHVFRLAWRHYLNNDQYVEQKQFYYELGVNTTIDSEGMGGIGYDAALGWDLCHHFGFELKWNQSTSSTYESRSAYAQIVSRF
ncbi:MAG: tetratricopeptide repeat protein [Phycisphaerae bacterium]|nr:tetratricopeptide repeat protein [Phycisphaerae bacterium]